MPATKRQSIGPFRVTPTSDMKELTRSLNQQLALITTHLNDRMGFSGPVKLHDHADLQGNHLQNYPDAPPTGSAASVAQLQAIQSLIDDLQRQANAIQARLLQVAGLTTTAPTQIDAADVAAVGTSPLASPGDHGHAVNTGAAGDLAAVSTSAAAGTSLKLPRADHVHVIAAAAWASPGAIGGTSAAAGTFTSVTTPLVRPVGAGTLTVGDVGGGLAFTAAGRPTYVITNSSVDRGYDSDSTSLDEVADVLATLIADLRAYGLVL